MPTFSWFRKIPAMRDPADRSVHDQAGLGGGGGIRDGRNPGDDLGIGAEGLVDEMERVALPAISLPPALMVKLPWVGWPRCPGR